MSKSFVRVLLGLFLVAGLLGVAAAPGESQTEKNSGAPAQVAKTGSPEALSVRSVRDVSYQLGIGDVVQVNVWREPELSLQTVVRPDGKITVPLAGDLPADGLTTDELARSIETKLKDFLRDPRVTVVVAEVKSKYFYVVGEVFHPGSYPLLQPTTVLQGLSLSGGFRDFANTKSIYIMRNHDGQPRLTRFNYKAVIKGQSVEQNIYLRHGDTIVVP